MVSLQQSIILILLLFPRDFVVMGLKTKPYQSQSGLAQLPRKSQRFLSIESLQLLLYLLVLFLFNNNTTTTTTHIQPYLYSLNIPKMTAPKAVAENMLWGGRFTRWSPPSHYQ